MKLKNKRKLTFGLFIIFCLSCVGQTKKLILKHELHYSFFGTIIDTPVDANVYVSGVKPDSTFEIIRSQVGIRLKFKIKSNKGACDFEMLDSLKKRVIKGGFKDGISLLKDQRDAFNANGETVVTIEKFYKGIPDGKWTSYNLNGEVINSTSYNKKTKSETR